MDWKRFAMCILYFDRRKIIMWHGMTRVMTVHTNNIIIITAALITMLDDMHRRKILEKSLLVWTMSKRYVFANSLRFIYAWKIFEWIGENKIVHQFFRNMKKVKFSSSMNQFDMSYAILKRINGVHHTIVIHGCWAQPFWPIVMFAVLPLKRLSLIRTIKSSIGVQLKVLHAVYQLKSMKIPNYHRQIWVQPVGDLKLTKPKLRYDDTIFHLHNFDYLKLWKTRKKCHFRLLFFPSIFYFNYSNIPSIHPSTDENGECQFGTGYINECYIARKLYENGRTVQGKIEIILCGRKWNKNQRHWRNRKWNLVDFFFIFHFSLVGWLAGLIYNLAFDCLCLLNFINGAVILVYKTNQNLYHVNSNSLLLGIKNNLIVIVAGISCDFNIYYNLPTRSLCHKLRNFIAN